MARSGPTPRRKPLTTAGPTPVDTAHAEDAIDPSPTTEPGVAPVFTPPPAVVAPKAAPAAAAPFASAEPVETASSIFDAANEARRQGDYARAIFLHRRLQIMHPTSRETHVSYGTVGRLLLDRGDAVGALRSFDSYQARGGGPLDEPVLVGRATALERLGRTEEARVAWNALLNAFPDTPSQDGPTPTGCG